MKAAWSKSVFAYSVDKPFLGREVSLCCIVLVGLSVKNCVLQAALGLDAKRG